MTQKPKMRRCFYCGEEIGAYADYNPLDTCGEGGCEREEAHEKLDRDMGY